MVHQANERMNGNGKKPALSTFSKPPRVETRGRIVPETDHMTKPYFTYMQVANQQLGGSTEYLEAAKNKTGYCLAYAIFVSKV